MRIGIEIKSRIRIRPGIKTMPIHNIAINGIVSEVMNKSGKLACYMLCFTVIFPLIQTSLGFVAFIMLRFVAVPNRYIRESRFLLFSLLAAKIYYIVV
jgi:hypothetical protein